MLLSEKLLLEAIYNERNLIFDKPELIDAAKQCFITGKVACHALDPTRHDLSVSKESHSFAVKKLFGKEYVVFVNKYNEYTNQMQYAEQHGDGSAFRAYRQKRDNFAKTDAIPAFEPRTVKATRLFPYSQANDGTIARVYVTKDKVDRIKVIVDVENNTIVTTYKMRSADFDSRIIDYESLELLKIKEFGTLDVEPVNIYAAIKNFTSPLLTTMKKDKIMNKFFNSIGVAPQVKQKAIRDFEEELRSRV